MKNGFTLVELIVVIAIIGVVSVLIGSNFLGLIGDADKYEKVNLYKYLNEAACGYIDSKDRDAKYDDCYSGKSICNIEVIDLYNAGFIDENIGLLNNYKIEDLDEIIIKASWVNQEKKCCVYKEDDGNVVNGVEGACS